MQHHVDRQHPEGGGLEIRAIKLLLAVSLVSHALVFWIDPSGWFNPSPIVVSPEWEIEAQWLASLPASPTVTKEPTKEQPAPEPAVATLPRELLPQLPKKFSTEDESPPEEKKETVDEHADKSKDLSDVKESESKTEAHPKEDLKKDNSVVETKKMEEAKSDIAPEKPSAIDLVKKDDDATKLFKQDLMDRLLKEQLRKEAKIDKKVQEPSENKVLSDKLAQLKKQAVAGAAAHATIDDTHPYILAVKGYINENYSIPEVYSAADATTPPIVSFKVNSNGSLTQSKLYQSSQNAALDQYALKSISEAAPFFPKPPPEIVGRSIQIRFQRRS